jgi:hypothetical protein
MAGNARITNSPAQARHANGTTHVQRTISSSAIDLINFTPSSECTHFFVQFTGATARVTFDGATDPTASLGFTYVDSSSAFFLKDIALSAKAIRAGSTDVVAEIQEINSY